MATNSRAEFRRLMLKIERDLVALADLRAQLTTADETITSDRKTLRAVKARIKRTRSGKGVRTQR
jgi:transcriptional antiterminator